MYNENNSKTNPTAFLPSIRPSQRGLERRIRPRILKEWTEMTNASTNSKTVDWNDEAVHEFQKSGLKQQKMRPRFLNIKNPTGI